MGVPAVSFFPGDKLLSVDKALISEKALYHSRDADKIVGYLKTAKRREFDAERSGRVQTQVFGIIDSMLEKTRTA